MRAPRWLTGLLSRRAAPWPDMILSVRPGSHPTVQRCDQRIELHLRDAQTGLTIRVDFAPTEAAVLGEALRLRADAAKREAIQALTRSQRLNHEEY
jgi:hypothetical protein